MDEKEFLQFIADIFGCNIKEISLNTTPQDIEAWDSLMQIRLIGEINEKYGIAIPINEALAINSLGDFYRYVK